MKSTALFLSLLLFGITVFAAENSTILKLENAVRPKRFEEDQRITDKELKAQSGALSRYSLKFDLSFAGPAINDLSNPNMPNPDNRPRPNRTSLSGYTGARYRMDSNSAINLSTGLRWYTPYQQVVGEDTEKPKGENDFELANPQLSYDRTYLLSKAQMRSTLRTSYITQDYYQMRAERASAGFTQSMKMTPFNSRAIAGLAIDFDQYFFDRGYQEKWPGSKTGDGKVSNYYLSLIPSLEYKLTDNLNLKTSIGWSYSNQRRFHDAWTWEEVEPTGRVGFGYSLTREIYLSPYVGFYSKRPSLASTNLAFSTVFSIF